MRVLVSWLREFVPVDAGVQELADVLTMRGFEVSAIEPAPAGVKGGGDDAVLDLEVTTNRPDCLNVLGVARELATVYDRPLGSLTLDPPLSGDDPSDVSVTIDDPTLCPRYVASVADVTVGPSPGWLAARLEAGGVRPINNLVDITNYVMLEMGHPMHAFDLERLAQQTIRVRRAAPGERVRTLDGQDRPLQPEMLVIADAARPQAVAGVMGGADSEVSGATRRVALESAYFLPTSVRRTSKTLALSTDASYRFERGADIHGPILAMRRALALLTRTGAGSPRGPIVDEFPGPRPPVTLRLRHPRIGRVLGVTVEPEAVPRILSALGFGVEAAEPDGDGPAWTVEVPTFRVDVSREIDLIEEVARHYGYDKLPSTFPALVRPPAPRQAWQRRQQVMRQVLTAGGCSEAITYSFIEAGPAATFASHDTERYAEEVVAPIANPLSEKYAVLRPSLLPGLVDSLVRNRRREHRDVRLFEIGKCFDRAHGESGRVALALVGTGDGEHWSLERRSVDLFDVTGIVERLCEALGVTPTMTAASSPVLVEGRSAVVTTRDAEGREVTLGHVGQLRPDIAADRGLPQTDDDVYVAELDVGRLAQTATDRDDLIAEPVPRYPAIVRDLAIVIDRALPAAAVRGTIQAAAPDTLVGIHEFDRYEGKGVPDGCVSLAFRLTFRAPDRTLTDVEVQAFVDTVVATLEQRHGATLR